MQDQTFAGLSLLGSGLAFLFALWSLPIDEETPLPRGEMPIGEGRTRVIGPFEITPLYFNGRVGRERQFNRVTKELHFRSFRWVFVNGIPQEESDSMVQ